MSIGNVNRKVEQALRLTTSTATLQPVSERRGKPQLDPEVFQACRKWLEDNKEAFGGLRRMATAATLAGAEVSNETLRLAVTGKQGARAVLDAVMALAKKSEAQLVADYRAGLDAPSPSPMAPREVIYDNNTSHELEQAYAEAIASGRATPELVTAARFHLPRYKAEPFSRADAFRSLLAARAGAADAARELGEESEEFSVTAVTPPAPRRRGRK